MKRVLVDSSMHHTRIALVENGELTEFIYEGKLNKSIVGNIYVGRVMSVHKGMQACFVDIGEEKNAYLLMENHCKFQPYSQMAVQVKKDASGLKGAVVTNKISFTGKFLVLIPDENGNIGISKKIVSEEERERIKIIAQEVLPRGYGIIIRTEGAGKSIDEFKAEIDRLYKISQEVMQSVQHSKAPSLVFSEADTIVKAARDLFGDDVDEIMLNDETEYRLIKEKTSNRAERVLFYDNEVPMFENYLVESQVEKIFNKKVWLKCGGFLIIEQTEACVVIDVNTGKYTGKKNFQETVLKTNLEAAVEIAKQLRLRNLSGMIIIDFIDMKEEENKKQLHRTLERAVKKDRIKTNVVGMTELGLMQVTRKKTSIPVVARLTDQCQCCKGSGYVQSFEYISGKIRREVVSIFVQTIFNEVTISSSRRILRAFAGDKDENKKEIEKKFGKTIVLKEIETAAHSYYEIDRRTV
jgi:ribonuclease, Rne/Rng family